MFIEEEMRETLSTLSNFFYIFVWESHLCLDYL